MYTLNKWFKYTEYLIQKMSFIFILPYDMTHNMSILIKSDLIRDWTVDDVTEGEAAITTSGWNEKQSIDPIKHSNKIMTI